MIKNFLKNKIIIITLLILSFIGILSSNISVEAAGKSWIDPNGQGDDTPKVYINELRSGQQITFGAWSYNENVFCVQHGQKLIRVHGGSENYKLTDTYVITATDIKKNGISINPDSDLLNYAQGVAYILSLDNTWTGTTDDALGTNEGLAQHVLWAYINDSNLCKEIGMLRGEDFTPKGDEIAAYNTAVEISNGNRDKDYEATYHIFQNVESGDPTQRLIILEKTGETEITDDLQISIDKVDAIDSSKLKGAKFTIEIQQLNYLIYNTIHTAPVTTDENGFASTGVISGIDTSKKIRVVIKETDAPEDYKKLKDDIKFNLKYNGTEWVLDGSIPNLDGFVSGNVSSSKVSLTIKNQEINSISLNLLKESSIGEITDGTEFSFDFTNVSDFQVAGKYIGSLFEQDKLYTIKKSSDSGKWVAEELDNLEISALIVKNKEIFIKEINFENPDNEVEITINEITPPVDHGKIETEIKIKVKLDDDKAVITQHTEKSDEIKEIKVDGTNKFQINLELVNFAYIDVKGKVWLDGQTGLKSSTGYDGIMNDTFVFEGIKVSLGLDGEVLEDIAPVYTNSEGKYEFLSVKYRPGLYVIFEYDGIKYIATKKVETADGINSDVTENSREEFNKKFALIASDGAYSTSGNKTIELKYDEESSETKAIVNTTYTETRDDDTIKVTRDFSQYDSSEHSMFDMTALTEKIETYESIVELNCGLVKREYDLDLSTNLEAVKTTVNGKTADYKYSIDDNSVLYIREQGDEGRPNKVGYNQKIYESDYNYNIGDYFNNTGDFLVDDTSCVDKELQNDAGDITETDELEIYVKYKLQINNQTNKKAYVFGISDYYSTDLEFESLEYDTSKLMATKTDNTEEGTSNKLISNIEGKNYYSMNININSIGGNYIEDSEEIYLIFKVKKYNADGSPTTGWKNIGTDSGLNINHIAEITSYGSDDGFIDMNSAPGNAIQGSSVRFEDDTDEAGNLEIKVDKNEERILSGIVWDDIDKDSQYDSGETLIDGVTVQLIELREVNGITLEYIWQETKTGINKLDRVNITGTGIEKGVPNGVAAGSGEFKFVGYIPGNYIVRYKYGTEEMLKDTDGTINNKYDGNAYKSTYNSTEGKYNAKTLNITSDAHDGSDAFDNEARRLEEMSIFAGETVTSATSADLKAHWMCADTSKFEVYFEDPKNNVESEKQTVKAIDNENIYNCTIENIDFGLMKRPETEISLEKHLTALAIDVAGEGKILEAVFDLKGFDSAGSSAKMEDHITGLKENLSTIYSERDERGFWKFETDVNELMNGAELTAEYTYVVYNNSEGDYLSAQLMNAYEQLNNGEPCQFIYEGEISETTLVPGVITFKTLLNDIANKTKLLQRKANADGTSAHKNGYYLGEYYYTGDVNNIVDLKGGTSESVIDGQGALSNWKNKLAGVTVRINKIEELVNKDFQFNESINYSSYGPYNNFTADSTKVTPEHGEDYFEYKEGVYTKSPIENLETYTIIQSRNGNKSLQPNEKDYSRKIVLTKTLNTSNINDMLFDSYNAEILSYSVASGRKSTSSTPGNLAYSYSANSEDTLISMNNETDEFWGETIIITAPTGNNTALWIILGVTCALIIAGGVFGIKKFAFKH